MLKPWVSVGHLFTFQHFLFQTRVTQWKRRRREAPFYYFTPAGPVYAFLANLYWRPADVGRRTVCTILSPAFLCLSVPPLRTCSLAMVCLCVWLAGLLAGMGWAQEMRGQNANSASLLNSIKACEGVCLCVQDCCHVWGHRSQDVSHFWGEMTLNCSENAPNHFARCSKCLCCLTVACVEALSLHLMDKRSKYKWGNDK